MRYEDESGRLNLIGLGERRTSGAHRQTKKKTWLASLQIQTLDDRGAPVEVEMPLEEQQPNKKKLGKNGKKER